MQIISALTFDKAQDLLDVLFETKFEHLIGFIENDGLNVTEVNITTVKMVQDTTSSAHENFAATFKLLSLFLHRNTTVDSGASVLHRVVLDLLEDFGDLDGKFTGRGQDNCLCLASRDKALFTQIFGDWESKT